MSFITNIIPILSNLSMNSKESVEKDLLYCHCSFFNKFDYFHINFFPVYWIYRFRNSSYWNLWETL